ncbi:MAG: hypothetical protein O3C57_04745, partial [Verrucomicrobia bacterium]|nr:hypothetical protein [Verrucomicrobiota bacterium]
HTLARLELYPALLLAGDRVHEMKMRLLDSEHPFDVLGIDEITSASIAAAEAFLHECNLKRRTAILTVQGVALADCLPALMPGITRRVHVLRPAGPLRNSQGAVLNYVHVNEPLPPALRPEDVALANLGTKLLAVHPGTHFSVCSPWQLLQELFTVKGAGTVIRRNSRIDHITNLQDIDEPRLLELLKQAFARDPIPERFMPRIDGAYIEEHYRGAALIESHPAGTYLSKFAVGTQARGEGLANELWRAVVADHPALFWRSRCDHPVNHWYERNADGSHREGMWRIFWSGIPYTDLPAIIAYCLQREPDFHPSPTTP